MNCIEIGVMPEDYSPIENKICVKSLGFHFANGKVHDTNGDKSKQSTKWREVCAPAMKGTVGTVELELDWDTDRLYWKF
jgi:hypothetical protein